MRPSFFPTLAILAIILGGCDKPSEDKTARFKGPDDMVDSMARMNEFQVKVEAIDVRAPSRPVVKSEAWTIDSRSTVDPPHSPPARAKETLVDWYKVEAIHLRKSEPFHTGSLQESLTEKTVMYYSIARSADGLFYVNTSLPLVSFASTPDRALEDGLALIREDLRRNFHSMVQAAKAATPPR